ncbi:hypothetical protein HDU81_010283, partial [Chytriomyces hyalinus]
MSYVMYSTDIFVAKNNLVYVGNSPATTAKICLLIIAANPGMIGSFQHPMNRPYNIKYQTTLLAIMTKCVNSAGTGPNASTAEQFQPIVATTQFNHPNFPTSMFTWPGAVAQMTCLMSDKS